MQSYVTNELDYKDLDVSHGTYQMVKMTPINANNSQSLISGSGGNEILFEIPEGVYNYGRSYLRMDLSIADQGALKFNWARAVGTPMIRQMQVYDRNNTKLMDIQDLNKYMDMVVKYKTIPTEAFINSSIAVNATGALNAASGFITPIPYNSVGNTTSTSGYQVGAVGVTAASYTGAGSLYCQWLIPFSLLYDTFLSIDKDFKFSTATYIRFTWAPSAQITWSTPSATDPVTGGLANAQNIVVNNINLYAAKEMNPVIIQTIEDKLKTGLKVNLPYLYELKVSTTGASVQNIQQRFNRGHGKRLQSIYWTPYEPTETLGASYDKSNYTGSAMGLKTTTFYATVNNIRLQQYDLNCVTGEDFLLQRKLLVGSCISSPIEYAINFMYTHHFDQSQSLTDYPLSPDKTNFSDGLPLDQEQIIIIVPTTAVSCVHYLFGLVQREMNITSSGTYIS